MPKQTPEGWVPRVGDRFMYGARTILYQVTEAPDLAARRPVNFKAIEVETKTRTDWSYDESYPYVWQRNKPTIIIQCKNL